MTHTNGTLKNLSDFDFDVKIQTRRGVRSSGNITDGYCTIGVKGRLRKANNHNLSISAFAMKNGVSPTHIAIGQNKYSKRDVIMVLDNEKLSGSARIGRYEKSNQWVVNGASHAVRLFELFGIDVPDKPDTSMTLRFNMLEIKGQPKVYTIEPVSLTRIDSVGQVTVHQYKKVTVS